MEPRRRPRLLGPESLKIGLAVFIGLSLLAWWLWATHPDAFFHAADARGFRSLARDPIPGPRASVGGTKGDAVYHIGRILLPGMAWLLAAGRASAVGWTLVIVNVVAVATLGAAGAELLARAGRRQSHVFWLALFPGLWRSYSLVYSELLGLALVFLVYLLWVDDRPRDVRVVVAFVPLARETAFLCVLPLVWRSCRRDGMRGAVSWLPCVFPTLVWWTVVWARMGSIPPLANSTFRHGVLGLPFSGLVSSWNRNGWGLVFGLVFMECAVVVVGAVFVMLRYRWFPFAPAAALMAGLVVCLGWRGTWYVGETLRHTTTAYVMVAMCFLLGSTRREHAEPSGSPMVQPDRELSRSRVSP